MCSCPAHTELADCVCNCDHSGDRISQWHEKARRLEKERGVWKERALLAEDRAFAAESRLGEADNRKTPVDLRAVFPEHNVGDHEPGCMRPNPHYGPCLNAEGIERLGLHAAATRHVSLAVYNLTPFNLPRAIKALTRTAIELAVEGFDVNFNAGTLDDEAEDESP